MTDAILTAFIFTLLLLLGAAIGGAMEKHKQKKRPHPHDCCDRVVGSLHEIHGSLNQIKVELQNIGEKISAGAPVTPTVGLTVTAAKGRSTMAIKPVPPLTLSDVERVELSLAPKLPDGSDDPGPFTWTSSDQALGQIVGEDADGQPDPANTAPTTAKVWLLTPAGPGTFTVTSESASPNVDGNSMEVTLTEGRTGNVNLSAGTPVSDQP